jgi:hypothetical protein
MAEIVRKCITTYYDEFGIPTPFNVISTTSLDDENYAYSTLPDRLVARTVYEKLLL